MWRVGDLGIVILTIPGWFNLVVYRDSYDVYLYILCYPHLENRNMAISRLLINLFSWYESINRSYQRIKP